MEHPSPNKWIQNLQALGEFYPVYNEAKMLILNQVRESPRLEGCFSPGCSELFA